MKTTEDVKTENELDARDRFVNSEGGNKEFREFMWDEMGDRSAILFEPGCMDGGIVGIVEGGEATGRVVYDYEKLCEALAVDYLKFNDSPDNHNHVDGYTFDDAYMEAVEWVEYNTLRSLPYAGPMAPIVIRRCPGLDD